MADNEYGYNSKPKSYQYGQTRTEEGDLYGLKGYQTTPQE
jgi:hypothetical protein